MGWIDAPRHLALKQFVPDIRAHDFESPNEAPHPLAKSRAAERFLGLGLRCEQGCRHEQADHGKATGKAFWPIQLNISTHRPSLLRTSGQLSSDLYTVLQPACVKSGLTLRPSCRRNPSPE